MKSRIAIYHLSESGHRQLNMYTLAAEAAGVSLLALAQPSEAKIVYTHADIQLGMNQRYDLDLNHDGITDFTIEDFRETQSLSRRCGRGHRWIKDSLTVLPTQDDGIEGSGIVDALLKGQRIGKSQVFYSGAAAMAIDVYGFYAKNYHCYPLNDYIGKWVNVTNRFIGLKFIIQGKVHYGWARLSVQIAEGAGITATRIGYAYETTPGKSIVAGRTKGAAEDPTNEGFGSGASLTNPIPDTPQPASVGMLALGAQGVPLWRRKESEG